MDAGRFDALLRSLALGSSRRTALGGLLAGTLSLVGLTETEAKKKKGKGKKGKGKDKKKDQEKSGSCQTDDDCEFVFICTNGQCVVGCHSDRDCLAGDTCRISRSQCGPGECDANGDCAARLGRLSRCTVDHRCEAIQCITDTDCPRADQHCRDNFTCDPP